MGTYLSNIARMEELFNLDEERELSLFCDLSRVQDSFRFRAQRRSIRLAGSLIDERGELREERLPLLINALESMGIVFYDEGYHDALLVRHQLSILRKLQNEPQFFKTIKKFQKPLCHRGAEQLVRESLGLVSTALVTDADVRKAVLSACLTLLRQNVGSCFATAPAILIHEEQLEHFLHDLHQILSTGKLKRTFGGVEHAVPLSPSSGIGDLKKAASLETKIFYSPGLILALETTGLIPVSQSWKQKIEMARQAILPLFKLREKMTVEELIQELLLRHFGIARDEIEKREKPMRHDLLFFAKGSKKRELREKFFQKEKEAKTAFKSLADHALLKAWEFTLASFSEVKMEFSRWNLYVSLGFPHQEGGGIGELVYLQINDKVQESNQKMQEIHAQYELAFDQLRATEVLLRSASSEAEVRRLRAEHQSRYYHMQSCLDLRNEIYATASSYATLFSSLFKKYEEKFPEYFQEIYDAEMQEVQVGQYDDSPAGFRLVYKHGRSDPSSWTLVRNAHEWIEALIDFFNSVEYEVKASLELEPAQAEVSHLTTAIIAHLRSSQFLDTAMERMAKAHRTTQSQKKPWAYISGGTMETLVKTYFRREGKITMESRVVESEIDLLIFLLDTFKNLPPFVTNLFHKNPEKRMLMHSPTHAFVLQPGWELFKEGWEDSGFTYTWVRDNFLLPREAFFAKMLLSPAEQTFLLERFSTHLPPILAHRCQKAISFARQNLSLLEFRSLLAEAVPEVTILDSFLYESLPLIDGREWKQQLVSLLKPWMSPSQKKAIEELTAFPAAYLTRKEIETLAKRLLAQIQNVDVHLQIALRSAEIELAPPRPLLFGDSNWACFHFAFLVNPATRQLELWRMDRTGSTGFPMTSWKEWLQAANEIPWIVYTHPHEYA
jgi:hypothetical protein